MIAIIPARGGSKGVPGKNIKELGGIPLIAYTINAALAAKCIDDVVVSTDSRTITAVARKYGARVPFTRPAELASDTASAIDVYLHAVDFLGNEKGKVIEKFMVLLPTSPFRTAQDIDDAYELFQKKEAKTLVAVTEASVPIAWYLNMQDDNFISPYQSDTIQLSKNRQQSDAYVIPCGAIYILDRRLLEDKRTYYCPETVGFLMSKQKATDIDDMDDFEYAQYLISMNIQN